jgi:hypothetical protein
MGARTAKKPEMRRDDPDGAAGFQFEFGDDRASRLQSRKGDLTNVADDAASEKQNVPMPAMCQHVSRHGDERETSLAFDAREVEQTFPVTETPVSLLQGYDVGIYFVNDPESSLGVESSVGADAFVDVVGSHEHASLVRARRRRRLSGTLPTHSKLFEHLRGTEPVHDRFCLPVDRAPESHSLLVYLGIS